ncbi:hypothetical protein [Kribbella sp. VKM Ac-2568]|uniref:hypothetical protein n=1 Tax=Kribbella sp. VKM Ac-2568 TaxID=2512219 RepID=UPI00104F52A9|nr:hypothetical protein [Kribbella sp. VKM Ac-2568]
MSTPPATPSPTIHSTNRGRDRVLVDGGRVVVDVELVLVDGAGELGSAGDVSVDLVCPDVVGVVRAGGVIVP